MEEISLKNQSASIGSVDTNTEEGNGSSSQDNNDDTFERQMLESYIKESQEKLAARAELRSKNIEAAINRQELNTSKLDSSLKKNTAFIKKLRNLTEGQLASLEKELLGLNLSKYVTELTQAIMEARLKMSDINAAVHISSLLHQRYQDFSQALLQNWQKLFNFKKDEKPQNMSKLRVDLRLYAELVSAGIFTQKDGLPLLGGTLTTLINSDKEEHNNISVILTFCKYCGDDYLGIAPRKFKILADKFNVDLPMSDFLKKEKQKNVRGLMREYFQSLVEHVIREHKGLRKWEQQNMKILQTKGELNETRKATTESMTEALNKLLSNAEVLADLLNEKVPEMPAIKTAEEEEALLDGPVIDGEKATLMTQVIWDDDESRAFYTSLPQLKALLPSILYAESEQAAVVAPPKEDLEPDEADLTEEMEVDDDEEDGEEVLPPEVTLPDDEEEASNTTSRVLFEGYLNTLPNCISRDLVDSAALEFCLKFNTKPYRKKLVRALFLVPRTRLDLLPFYARYVASLLPMMPDVAGDLCSMLKQDFKYQVKKKDQINIETKIKLVRFIGELTKFSLFGNSETLQCLRLLLHDFKHHHIEMACNLLETCGRFLFRCPESHHRTKVLLEQMMRKKTVKSFDPRHNTMIENAFYYVNPPEDTKDGSQEVLTPMQMYIRMILYVSLNRSNTERILRQIRKLHWEDDEISWYVVKCLCSPWNAKFYNIRCIANLLAGLILHYDWVGTAVVDEILESIRLGMESNEPKFNQRRIASVKYLGEMYNYRIIESAIIFKVLYSFITFGVSWDSSSPSSYDPPFHLMRIRLVCTLLATCGQFFSSGSSKRRLDCFLTYFQYYVWFKKSLYQDEAFPWSIDHLYQDTLIGVRPKMRIFETIEQAQEAVTKLNKQIYDKAIQSLPSLKDFEDDNALHAIQEDEPVDSAETENMFVEMDDEEEDAGRGGLVADLEEGEVGLWPEMTQDGDSLTPSQHSQSSKFHANDENDEPSEDHSSGDLKSPDQGTDVIDLTLDTVKCAEDDDFMSEFDKMLSDNLLERSRDLCHAPVSNISLPSHVKSSAKKTYEQIVMECAAEKEAPKPVVNFVLLTRSGTKQQCNSVEMPVDSDLVTKLRSREEEERVERDRVKQLTLEINERQEEEESQELLQQTVRPPLHNLNRDRKPRFQHPRGVPDADLIFGSKKPK